MTDFQYFLAAVGIIAFILLYAAAMGGEREQPAVSSADEL